jgi:hypothetical protein
MFMLTTGIEYGGMTRSQESISAVLGGGIAALLTSPVELIMIQQQVEIEIEIEIHSYVYTSILIYCCTF